MKKGFIHIILIAALSLYGVAAIGSDPVKPSTDQKIQIVDHSNLETLPGASVYVAELDKVLFADFDGFVNLNTLPIGKYTLVVRMTSYKELRVENYEISAQEKSTKLRVKSVTL